MCRFRGGGVVVGGPAPPPNLFLENWNLNSQISITRNGLGLHPALEPQREFFLYLCTEFDSEEP